MDTLISILGAIVGLYVFLMLVIAVFARIRRPEPGRIAERMLRISVIVPARNEETTIRRCLDALTCMEYPEDKLEIIVADDHSSDATPEIIDEYASRFKQIRRLAVPEPSEGLKGKPHAVHQAIGQSSGDLVLMTDADCAPNPAWAARMADYFQDPIAGIVCGITNIEHSDNFSRIQAIDWMLLQTFSAGFSNVGIPVTAMGNNMGIRRSLYDSLGGFPSLPFSVTEDYILFRTVHKGTPFSARIYFDPELQNWTLPLPNFLSAFAQHKRWTKGALRVPLWIYALHFTVLLTHLAIPILVPLHFGLAIVLLIGKIIADFFVFWSGSVRAKLKARRLLWRSFGGYQLFFWAYVLLLPVSLLFAPNIEWKSRKY